MNGWELISQQDSRYIFSDCRALTWMSVNDVYNHDCSFQVPLLAQFTNTFFYNIDYEIMCLFL